MKPLAFLLACTALSLAPSVNGAILNPGFESNALSDGGILYSVVSNWTPNVSCCAVGTQNPTTSMFASGNSIEGNNFAYSNGGGFGYYQVLTDTFAVNTNYNFSMLIGHRLDLNFGSYLLEIRAGNSFASSPLASFTGSADPGSGQWGLQSVSYQTGSAGAELGQNILVSFGSFGVQTQFDRAQLTAGLGSGEVPEPTTYGLIGVSLLAIQRLRKRRSIS